MKRALITGITGQDGSYLAEQLLDRGYEVHGLVRRSSSFNTDRIEHLYRDPHEADVRLLLHYADLTESTRLVKIIYELQPDEIYHLGAQSHVRTSFDVPEYTADVVAMGTLRLLEAIRETGVSTRFYQASSEMFGSTPPPQSERTPFHPRSPYAVAVLERGSRMAAVRRVRSALPSPGGGRCAPRRRIKRGEQARMEADRDLHRARPAHGRRRCEEPRRPARGTGGANLRVMLLPDPHFWNGRAVTVTGGAGFLGQALVGQIAPLGAEVRVIRSSDYDLRLEGDARTAVEGASCVFHLAARVGGIGFNRANPAPLVHDNLAMGLNVFEQSRRAGVEKLVAANTVCAYPKVLPVPFQETDLWSGYPEDSNAPYGLAKKMLIVLSDAYRRQPLRARRQLRSRDLARDPGDDPQVRRGERARRGDRHAVGNGKALARVPLRGRRRSCARSRGGEARHVGAGKHRNRRGDADQGSGRDHRSSGRLRGGDRLGYLAARRSADTVSRRIEGTRAARVRAGGHAG